MRVWSVGGGSIEPVQVPQELKVSCAGTNGFTDGQGQEDSSRLETVDTTVRDRGTGACGRRGSDASNGVAEDKGACL